MQKELKVPEVVKIMLKAIFGNNLSVRIEEGTVKANVHEIDGAQLHSMSSLYISNDVSDVKIKRSGSGLVIIVELVRQTVPSNKNEVKYRQGLVFTFIGVDPLNSNFGYCLHPSAKDEDGNRRIDHLPIRDLEIQITIV